MSPKRPFIAVTCLLAGLWIAEGAFAQRSSSGGRGSFGGGGRSSTSSGGSMRSSGSSRPSMGSSSSSVGRSSVSRPSSSGSISRSVGSTGSRSSSSSLRSSPSSSGTSYRSSYSGPSYTSSGSAYSSSSRYSSRSSSTSTSVYTPPLVDSQDRSYAGRGYTDRSYASPVVPDLSGRADAGSSVSTWRARDTSVGSRPIQDSRIIDLSDAGAPQQVRFPQVSSTSRTTLTRPAPGQGRTLSQELRSRVSASDAARMRETLGDSTPVFRSGTVDREDILSRYRGSERARADDALAEVRDVRDLRRRVAETPSLSQRAGSTRSTPGTPGKSDAERAAAARSALEARDAERIAGARTARQARDAQRIEAARTNYADSVAASRTGDVGRDGRDRDTDGSRDDDWDDDCHDYYYDCYWDTWGWCWNYGWGWYWGFPAFYCGYWWHNYWYWGGYWSYGYCPPYYWYGPFYPYATVVYQSGPYANEVIYVYEEPLVEEVVVEAPPGEAVAAVPDERAGLNRAADYYLTLGDRAFRDGRFGDAVHFYAKAVEFAPEEGILYLILSDALFATGDYHYAAYALRMALEIDPALATNVVDKHSFYSDPLEFDRQLAVLELYLEDHFLDDDARLVLAANYLFGGRPAAAVDLMESAFSAEIRTSDAGRAIVDAARALQYGQPAEQR